MNLKGILLASSIVIILFSSGCLDSSEDRRMADPNYETSYTGLNEVVNSSNEFSFEMYRELLDGDRNVFFSPYSMAIALGMAYEGARGETAQEIIDIIELPENDEERLQMVRDLQSHLNPGDVSYQLSTANAYWLRQGENLNDNYQDAVENYYLAGGRELDFSDSQVSADTINAWIEAQTNDRIKDLIDPSMLSIDTYMVLTNAIFFKANWKWQFDEGATQEDYFDLSDGGEKEVELMNICDEEIDLNYADNDDVQMLQLPYKDEELSMYILLPRGNDITSMEEELSCEYLKGLKSDLMGEWVDVYLPKFKFDLGYGLNDHLQNMGMEKAFDPDLADFSGIKESGENVYITDVVHKSFVEVNEKGTEAAAATGIVMADDGSGIGGSEPEPIKFRADHPFIFFIEHQTTGQILFMGKVEDPTVESYGE